MRQSETKWRLFAGLKVRISIGSNAFDCVICIECALQLPECVYSKILCSFFIWFHHIFYLSLHFSYKFCVWWLIFIFFIFPAMLRKRLPYMRMRMFLWWFRFILCSFPYTQIYTKANSIPYYFNNRLSKLFFGSVFRPRWKGNNKNRIRIISLFATFNEDKTFVIRIFATFIMWQQWITLPHLKHWFFLSFSV